MKTQEEYAREIDEIVLRDVESCQGDWFNIGKEIFMQPENKNKAFILGTRKTGCDLIVLGGTNCNEGSMDWLFGSLGNENFYVCQPASFYKSQQEIEKVNPLYAFKVATAYFRGQGLVPVFEDCHCRLIILRYGGGLDEDNNPITGGESKNGFYSPFAVNVYIIKNGEGVQVAQIDDVDIIECV